MLSAKVSGEHPPRLAEPSEMTGIIVPEFDQAATPSFFCRLVDEVVYWKVSFFSGYT